MTTQAGHPSDPERQASVLRGADPAAEVQAQREPAGAPASRGTVAQVREDLRGLLPEEAVLTDPARLATYECDGLAAYRVTPGLVVLASRPEHVAATVRACARHRVPFVARGSGTGLSGGALPHADGVLVVTSQLRTLHEVSGEDQRAVVDPGVINLQVSQAATPLGYYFAPDPSSQQICSIGGNVAENSGGAHCLKYGFTTNHVLSLDVVTPDGEQVTLGTRAPDAPGYDLIGAFVGSEGTLGVATRATVRLVRLPEDVRTVLAGFDDTDQAGAATSAIIASGIVPAAIEIMDALAIEAAEAAVQCGYPEGAGAVLLVEVDGPTDEVAHELAEVERICREHAAIELRVATEAADRAAIWKGRKSAFAAVGRISPDYIVQDGVVPRTALGQVLRRMSEISAEQGVRVANVFHAGDGNLHPLVLFDGGTEGETERAENVSGMILDLCIEQGGSITGEHGVGSDKARYMPRMFTDEDLDTMQLVRCAFDPDGIANPGKIYPTPRLCGERPGRHQGAHPLQETGVAEIF
ncbi:FAD-linked oxidase C-terminal domain-containing protein [Ornithinicoccus halotolerans]|uniref:FAD-linked oxidase C-terminal domain-containing protein n=1 Tax=Ornithinicoccus halotolerans TaxID=1748220 RepID=UPI001296B2B0|nr:FAD-linked oxidase C-terminal domain-containing protein [Ornithinicoccus halotolerans]